MTEGLTDDEQRSFRSGRGFIDQIFTVKEIGDKACEKTRMVSIEFYGSGESI